VQWFASTVCGKEDRITTALHQPDGIETVNSRVEGDAQRVVGQAVKTKKKGYENNEASRGPEDF
jgi:hypothetical protein